MKNSNFTKWIRNQKLFKMYHAKVGYFRTISRSNMNPFLGSLRRHSINTTKCQGSEREKLCYWVTQVLSLLQMISGKRVWKRKVCEMTSKCWEICSTSLEVTQIRKNKSHFIRKKCLHTESKIQECNKKQNNWTVFLNPVM